jgi:glutamyl-tRNA reductase
MRQTVPAVDGRPAPAPVGEPSTPYHRHDPSSHQEPAASTPMVIEGDAVRSASPQHRRRAAALIRRLGGRTESELRRELDRFFASRPGLGDEDRALIARAMARFRNQLLHHPRRSLRAVAADDPAGVLTLLDAVHRLFGLAESPHGCHNGPRTPAGRTMKSSTSSVAP